MALARSAIGHRNQCRSGGEDARQFGCLRCGTLVVICRACDRGNRYCNPVCASEARNKRQREASRLYQRTSRGARNHAARQDAYRHRQRQRQWAKRVTHPGSSDQEVETIVVGSGQEHDPTHENETSNTYSSSPDSKIDLEHSDSSSRVDPSSTNGVRPCCICGRPCGPLVRTERLALGGLRLRRTARPPRVPPPWR